MYPDDMPAELIQQTMVTSKVPVPESTPVAEEPAGSAVDRPRAILREVVRQEPVEPPAPVAPVETEGPKDDPPAPRRGHLRLVK